MSKKIPGKNRRFKHLAPTLVVGATIFGVSGALAGFKAIVHDDTRYVTCDVDRLEQDADGVTAFLEPHATCYQHLKEADFGTAYSLELGNNNGQAGCTLDSIGMNGAGQLTIKAGNGCLLSTAPDTDCFIDDNNTPNDLTDDNAFVLNVSYDLPSICDPDPDIDTRAKSITAGNVSVGADVEFRTRANGTIRLLPPFTVASNHIFRANTDPAS